MNWKLKLLGEKAIDILFPGEIGRKVHNCFQARMGKISVWNEQRQRAEISRGAKMAAYLVDKVGFCFEESVILEVGTGWHATDVILFHLLGAREIWTCDQLRHLDETLVLKQVAAFPTSLESVAAACGTDAQRMMSRYDNLASCRTLNSVLRSCQATYVAPKKLHNVALPQNHFDLFYSYSTLQRVPPDQLNAYLRAVYGASKAGSYSLHCIHHMDHNTRHQTGLSRLKYLQYSDFEYDLFQSKRFNYQNRLRHSEFLEIFESCGFTRVCEEVTHHPREALEGIQLAERFRKLPAEDIRIVRTQLLSQCAK